MVSRIIVCTSVLVSVGLAWSTGSLEAQEKSSVATLPALEHVRAQRSGKQVSAPLLRPLFLRITHGTAASMQVRLRGVEKLEGLYTSAVTADNTLIVSSRDPDVLREIHGLVSTWDAAVEQIHYVPLVHTNAREMLRRMHELNPPGLSELKITVDRDRQGLLLRGPETVLRRCASLIDELDIPRRQIKLDLLVLRVDDQRDAGQDESENAAVTLPAREKTDEVPAWEMFSGPDERLWRLCVDESNMFVIAQPQLWTTDGAGASVSIGQSAFSEAVLLQIEPSVQPDGWLRLDIYPLLATATTAEKISGLRVGLERGSSVALHGGWLGSRRTVVLLTADWLPTQTHAEQQEPGSSGNKPPARLMKEAALPVPSWEGGP